MKKELGSKKINEITYRNRFSVLLSRKNNQVFLSRKICSFFVPVFKNPGWCWKSWNRVFLSASAALTVCGSRRQFVGPRPWGLFSVAFSCSERTRRPGPLHTAARWESACYINICVTANESLQQPPGSTFSQSHKTERLRLFRVKIPQLCTTQCHNSSSGYSQYPMFILTRFSISWKILSYFEFNRSKMSPTSWEEGKKKKKLKKKQVEEHQQCDDWV